MALSFRTAGVGIRPAQAPAGYFMQRLISGCLYLFCSGRLNLACRRHIGGSRMSLKGFGFNDLYNIVWTVRLSLDVPQPKNLHRSLAVGAFR